MIPADQPKVRFNEKLDHLQAKRPFTYNLVTGLIIGLVLVILGAAWWFALAYAPAWAAFRWFLWRDGRILRRQYETRQVRVAAEKEAKRRQR
jgi:hypothetical protein